MAEIHYKFNFEGLPKGASDANAAASAMQKLGLGISQVSDAFKKLNPQLFQQQRTMNMPPNWYVSQGQLFAKRMGPLFPDPYSGPIPPKIGVNWSGAALSAASAPFSPWLAARGLSNAFGQPMQSLFKSMGMQSGGGGLFGGGGFLGFQAMFLAINAAGRALKVTFDNLAKAVESGSKLFQASARTTVNTSQLFQMQSALQAVGMSPQVVEQMIIRGQHMMPGRGGAAQFPGTSQMVGWASGMGMVSEAQEMKNLSAYIEQSLRDSALDSTVMTENAKRLFELQYSINGLTREWRTMWVSLVGNIAPELSLVFYQLQENLRTIIFMTETWFGTLRQTIATLVGALNVLAAAQTSGLFAAIATGAQRFQEGYDAVMHRNTQPGSARVGSGNINTASDHAGWSRMGFVFRGGYGSHDYARQIAQNTSRMVDIMFRTLGMNTNTNGPAGAPTYNAP